MIRRHVIKKKKTILNAGYSDNIFLLKKTGVLHMRTTSGVSKLFSLHENSQIEFGIAGQNR